MSFLQDLFKPNVKELESRSDIQGLIKALGYKKVEVRSDAAKALGRLKDNHAVEPLIAVLENPDEAEFAKDRYLEERYLKASCRLGPSTHYLGEVAAEALGRIGDPRAVEPLIAALKYDPVRNDNMTYLYLNALSIKTLEEGMKIFHAFLLCGSLRRSAALRRAAAEALGQIGDSRTVELLRLALQDEDKDVRQAAAGALRLIGAPSVKPLSAAPKDKDVEPLIAALKDGNKDVRRATAEMLGEIGDPRTVEPLLNMLRDGSWRVRQAAAGALGRISDPRAVEPLSAALQDVDEDVQQTAAWALKQINNKPGRDEQAGRKETSSVGKQKAHELAVAWWSSDKSNPLRATGHATCDLCNRDIPIDGGYLCNPKTGDLIGVYSVIGSSTPDLMCEQCFDRESPEPWDPERTARNLERAKTVQDRLFPK